jgi:methionine sulfoxide reductase heme-binding subunit
MTIKNLNDKSLAWLKAVIFLLALMPLTKLGLQGYHNALGANPIEKITRTTGYWTLVFLFITLSVTPLRRLSGWQWLVRLRRMLGLFAFFYGTLHFLTYLVLDQFFDWDGIVRDILKRPYITVGFPSFLLMLPLAVTSTNAMIRRLGGKRWQRLHRLVYVCSIGGVAHFWWLVKKDLSNPIIFAVLLSVLLAYRVVYNWLQSRKQRLPANATTSPVRS